MPCTRLLLALALLVTTGLGPAARADDPVKELPAVRRLLRDPSPSARAAAYRRLAGSVAPEVVAVLVQGLADPHPYVRRAVAGVLGVVDDGRTRQRLANDAPRWRAEVARAEVCQSFSLWLDDVGVKALLVAAKDPSPAVRIEALRWLADDPAPEAHDALRTATGDTDPAVRAEAWSALVSGRASAVALGGPGGHQALDLPPAGPALADGDARVRMAALEAVALRGGPEATSAVVAALTDPVWSVRLVAADLAARQRSRAVLEPLVKALGDARVRVVSAAGRALVALTGIPFDPEPTPWRAWLDGDGRTFDPALRPEGAAAPPDPPPLPAGSRTTEARFLGLTIRSRNVAFVLDGSGSMSAMLPTGRTRWQEIVLELEKALDRLAGAHVNVAVFHDGVEAALPRALPLDAARREALLKFVRARSPRGKTALYDGMRWGLGDPEVDTLVVLSDGAPSAGQFFTRTDLLAELKRANRWRRARIDVIAVGADAVARRWRDALQEISEGSGGTYLAR
jgi:HEAT repeat protein